MVIPDFAKLAEHKAQLSDPTKLEPPLCHNYASGIHPNPYFYKYYWWIFWSQSPVDGRAFLDKAYRINTAGAARLCERLAELGEPFWRYNVRLPRDDPRSPFDRSHALWQSREWTVSYEDDKDETWESPWGTLYK